MEGKRIGQGFIQPTSFDDVAFNMEFQNYQRSGYAMDMNSRQIIGNYSNFQEEEQSRQAAQPQRKKQKSESSQSKAAALLSELLEYGSDEDQAAGVWAPVKTQPAPALPLVSNAAASSGPPDNTAAEADSSAEAPDKSVFLVEPDPEDEKWERFAERKLGHTLPPRPKRGAQISAAATTFHAKSEKDFQGRSWVLPPQGVRPDDGDHACYLPKKCVKRIAGHSKGVQCIEYFPGTGHLLLSASMDSKCKIWSVTNDFELMRTYAGHTEGVRSMEMGNEGHTFLSSGYDRVIRHWDVETGKAIATFSNRKMAYCVRYNPRSPDQFLAACSDNRIYQWDVRSGEMVQEYNYHLQPCNTVTFCDEGRKFVSTSDDKKVLVWEFGIPVPIRYIQEPDMHSVPAVTLHPSGEYLAGQSMNNQIVVYSAGDRVRQVKNKVFTGHNNSGYACQIGFSPNGHYLMSGDGLGKIFFWDWASTRIHRKFQAHDNGPTMGAQWHPLHTNQVATCGWDGLIKIWE